MAGEWIAFDLGLPDKPEVQELIDLTGQPVEVVTFRLLQLWGWAALNTTDGRARMTVPRLVRTCGADEAFWRAVAAVGWLEIDETAATVAIPGWDRRFSQAAKARLQASGRAAASREKASAPQRTEPVRSSATPPCAQAHGPGALERTRGDRGDERREEVPPPPPREAWADFREEWNQGPGRPWTVQDPPEGWPEAVDTPGWLSAATEAIRRLPECRFFETPVTLIQFIKPGFVTKVLGGQFDATRDAPRKAAQRNFTLKGGRK